MDKRQKRYLPFLVLAFFGALPACSSAGSLPDLPAPQSEAYILSSGDKLRINIYGLDPFKDVIYAVGEDGMLSLPLLDKVPAAGKTADGVASEIREALLAKQILNDPFVNVQPASLRPFYILGEVNKPGEYEYRPGISVMAAVTIAGGFTYRANSDSFIILRDVGGRKIRGRAAPTDPIRPGDQITVSERWF